MNIAASRNELVRLDLSYSGHRLKTCVSRVEAICIEHFSACCRQSSLVVKDRTVKISKQSIIVRNTLVE